jgi:hypothetical protein
MSFIHSQSREVGKAELMLFGVPDSCTQVESYRIEPIAPLNLTSNTLEFRFCGSSIEEYVDFRGSRFEILLKLLHEDGTPLEEGESVGLVNNSLHSIFSSLSVEWNNTIIAQHTNTYHMKAYLINTVNFSGETKKGYLKLQMYYPDEGGQESKDSTVATSDENKYWKQRVAATAKSQQVDMVGPILDETLTLNTLLLSQVPVKVKLTKSNPSLCLMAKSSEKGYKVDIVEATYHIKIVRLHSAHALAIEKVLQSSTAKYPFTRAVVISRLIDGGLYSKTLPHLYDGRLPKRMWIAMTSHTGWTGNYTRNWQRLHHYNISELSVSIGGKLVPGHPMKMKFTNGKQFKRVYESMYRALGKLNSDRPIGIELEQFENGTAIFGLDTTPDESAATPYLPLIKSGSIDVHVKFDTALPEDVEMIMVLEIPSIIEIDGRRNVMTDYTLVA